MDRKLLEDTRFVHEKEDDEDSLDDIKLPPEGFPEPVLDEPEPDNKDTELTHRLEEHNFDEAFSPRLKEACANNIPQAATCHKLKMKSVVHVANWGDTQEESIQEFMDAGLDQISAEDLFSKAMTICDTAVRKVRRYGLESAATPKAQTAPRSEIPPLRSLTVVEMKLPQGVAGKEASKIKKAAAEVDPCKHVVRKTNG